MLLPSTGQVLGPQPDKSFINEFKNFKEVEREAEVAENSEYRKILFQRYLQNSNNKNSIIWISQKIALLFLLITGKNNKNINFDFQYNNMMHNVYYLVGIFKNSSPSSP